MYNGKIEESSGYFTGFDSDSVRDINLAFWQIAFLSIFNLEFSNGHRKICSMMTEWHQAVSEARQPKEQKNTKKH